MSLSENCLDPSGRIVRNGMPYYTAPSSCKKCICTNGEPDACKEEMCPTPQNCTTFRKGENCCDFVCLDEKPFSRSFFGVEYAYLGPRIVVGLIAVVVFGTFIFFLLHRLRKCKLRGVSGIRQNRQLSEDGRSLGSIGYITGSLGYLPSAMDRFEEPNAHYPHYPVWKPPGNYFPRGEAPPPYEEAVAAALAGHSHIHIHASAAGPFSRDAGHLSISYNNYAAAAAAANNLLGSVGHRTIPMNMATGANFNLQPERYDECLPTTQAAPLNNGTTRSIGNNSVGNVNGVVTSNPTPDAANVSVDDPPRLSPGTRRPWDLPLSLSLPHHYHRHPLSQQLSQTFQHLTPGSGEERTPPANLTSGDHESMSSLTAQHQVDNGGAYIATLRRGKRPTTINHGGLSSTGPRRAPLAIMTPTPPLSLAIQLPSHCRCPSRNLCICNNNPGVTGSGSGSGSSSGASASAAVSPSSGVSPGMTPDSVTATGSVSQPLVGTLSLSQSALDDNDDYRSECENCKSTHSSNYYLDEEDPEPEITMTLHRKPTETGDDLNYRTSLTLPTRHRMIPLHGTAPSCGARENWFNSMPETSSEESGEEEEEEEEDGDDEREAA